MNTSDLDLPIGIFWAVWKSTKNSLRTILEKNGRRKKIIWRNKGASEQSIQSFEREMRANQKSYGERIQSLETNMKTLLNSSKQFVKASEHIIKLLKADIEKMEKDFASNSVDKKFE